MQVRIGFALMDFSEMYLDQMNRKAREGEKQKAQDKELIDSGVVSALDLEAPMRAVEEFNHGSSLIKAQNSKEAIKHLEKAIADYPKFVSAHIGLGLAYADLEDTGRAKSEFEAAAKLDDKFPGSFLHLGQLELSLEEFRRRAINSGESCAASPQGRQNPLDSGVRAKWKPSIPTSGSKPPSECMPSTTKGWRMCTT